MIRYIFTFLIVWSMESGEHMPNKELFLKELHRVAKPGGRIIIVTWCHRETISSSPLQPWEVKLLQKISNAYFLPEWVPVSRYKQVANSLRWMDVRVDDWSTFVAPFWPAVIRSILKPSNFFKMLRSGKATIKSAIAAVRC